MSNFTPYKKSVVDLIRLWGNDEEFSKLLRTSNSIWYATQNPETPEIVKKHIRQYVFDLVSIDFMEYRAAVQILYSLACMGISEIPFIPNQQYIEALIGDDKRKALEATKNVDKDFILVKSISIEKAQKLVKKIIEGRDQENIPLILSHLILSVVKEPDIGYRNRLVDEIIGQCFNDSMRYTDEYFNFFKRAAKYPKS